MNLEDEIRRQTPVETGGDTVSNNEQQPQNQNNQGDQQQPQTNSQVDLKTQEQMDIFISNGMMMIHNSKVSDSILSKILKEQDKIKAIAEAMVLIINHLVDSAAQNGQALTNEVLVFGSNFLLGELISLAEAAGMQKLSDEQKTEVLQRGVGMFIDDAVKQGRITKDQLAALGEQVKQTPEGQKIMQHGGM